MDLEKFDIPTLIRIARAMKNMTQYEFAVFLKVSQATISNWENGTTTPSSIHFREILKILAK